MQIRYFNIPATDAGESAQELNRFLANHCVVDVNEQLVITGGGSYWAVSVHWLESNRPDNTGKRRQAARIDYKEIFSEAEFNVYAELRERRKELAEEHGIKVYTVFTNAQLAEMVSERIDCKAGLESIAGVGEMKLQQFGDAMLEVLQKHIGGLVSSEPAAVSHPDQ